MSLCNAILSDFSDLAHMAPRYQKSALNEAEGKPQDEPQTLIFARQTLSKERQVLVRHEQPFQKFSRLGFHLISDLER